MNKFTKISLFLFLLLASHNFAMAETMAVAPNSIKNDVTLKINSDQHILSKADISSWIKEKNDLIYNINYKSEIENTNICKYKQSILCKLLFNTKDERHIQKSAAFFVDTDAIGHYVDDLARQVNKDPIDAKLSIDDTGKVSVFSLSQKGVELDKNKSVVLLSNYLTSNKPADSLELPVTLKNPEIGIDSIDNLGITALIGEGHSDFKGSPKNRVFNIKVATNRFNGTLIKPGEEFSFVKILGEVDGEHGYLPELVIKKDKTEPEFGGGICQVSTTAFRAAIYSGLKITARRNHAYPVSYYNPQGMDSTVYVPKPDLRFINNTPSYILIQTEIVGTQLLFRFYGTSDGRKINVIGPTILEHNPDGSMKTTFTQQVFDTNNTLLREDIFNSSYDSPSKYPHPGQVLTQKPADWSNSQWKQYQKDNKAN